MIETEIWESDPETQYLPPRRRGFFEAPKENFSYAVFVIAENEETARKVRKDAPYTNAIALLDNTADIVNGVRWDVLVFCACETGKVVYKTVAIWGNPKMRDISQKWIAKEFKRFLDWHKKHPPIALSGKPGGCICQQRSN